MVSPVDINKDEEAIHMSDALVLRWLEYAHRCLPETPEIKVLIEDSIIYLATEHPDYAFESQQVMEQVQKLKVVGGKPH